MTGRRTLTNLTSCAGEAKVPKGEKEREGERVGVGVRVEVKVSHRKKRDSGV